jgi:hypothetical protein
MTRHRRLRLLFPFILFHFTTCCAPIIRAVIKIRWLNAQLYAYFQQFLQSEGVRVKLKGYHTNQMGKQAWKIATRGEEGPSCRDPQPFYFIYICHIICSSVHETIQITPHEGTYSSVELDVTFPIANFFKISCLFSLDKRLTEVQ